MERSRMGLDVLAYCLMPDHFHLIVGPCLMRLGQVVQGLKLASAHQLIAAGLAVHSPWQESFFDVGLRDETQLLTAIEYVHVNPTKEGLADCPSEYPLSSSKSWDQGAEGPIRLARDLAVL